MSALRRYLTQFSGSGVVESSFIANSKVYLRAHMSLGKMFTFSLMHLVKLIIPSGLVLYSSSGYFQYEML